MLDSYTLLAVFHHFVGWLAAGCGVALAIIHLKR